KFVTNTVIGKDRTVDDLLSEFDAVFLGTGAATPVPLRAPGTDLKGVYQATNFLIRTNLDPDKYLPPNMHKRPEVQSKRVAVIGGGDTAMDCVRTAVRLQAADVVCYYRRTEKEMPGNERDRELAKEEGGRFVFLTAPTALHGDEQGNLRRMTLIRMELGEPDESGRRRPIPIEGSEFDVDVDVVILALGYWPDPLMKETVPGLKTDRWGLIIVDEETGVTSRPGVYAGGDNVHGADLVVTAMAAARRAAQGMDEYLRSLS
ncbi:MAG TPA: dihydropyrimidine dehydrogenase, partial [Anaerolineae bacterium]|nr:dihydropyrimidine dehydrogenase [Anaerolineae bacterium]